MTLDDIRKEIDKADDAILNAFLQRMHLSASVAEHKKCNNLPIHNADREYEILHDVEAKSGTYAPYSKRLFELMFELSRSYQAELLSLARVCGLVGKTLPHSYSPEIHAMLGNHSYSLFELDDAELPTFFAQNKRLYVNVTVPYKKEALKYCDKLSADAQRIGAVNTVIKSLGVTTGYNTDKCGFESAIKQRGFNLTGKLILILGSGGAAQAVKAAAEDMLAKKVIIISRTGKHNYDNISQFSNAEIIINATPVGMFPNNSKTIIDLQVFRSCEAVIDLIYNPSRTPLLLQAEALKIPSMNGLHMLLFQAAASIELFTGCTIRDDEIKAAMSQLKRKIENISLIGLPGSGKSTVGKKLAASMQRPCIDTDAVIEEESGKTIPQIFSEYGEAHFRKLESEVINRFSAKHGIIIVTGGGAVNDEGNMNCLRQNGILVNLERAVDALDRAGRPLCKSDDGFEGILRSRMPLYKKYADYSIANNATAESAAEQIKEVFYESIGS